MSKKRSMKDMMNEAMDDMGKFKRPAKKNYTQKNIDHHMRTISKPPISNKSNRGRGGRNSK